MDPPLDPVVFQARAASYLRRKGRWDEDLCAEMVCYALEHPHVVLNLDLVYLRALDRLDPRHVQSGRGRVRQSRCTSALEDGPELATPDLMDL